MLLRSSIVVVVRVRHARRVILVIGPGGALLRLTQLLFGPVLAVDELMVPTSSNIKHPMGVAMVAQNPPP